MSTRGFHLNLGASHYSFPCEHFPPGRTTKLRNGHIDVPTTQVQIFYDHVSPATSHVIDQSAGGNLHDKNTEESWALIEDLALYENESWNDPRDSAKPVKAISLPQDVPNESDCIFSGPHDTQYGMENPEQAFVDYASSRNNIVGKNRLSSLGTQLKQQQDEVINKINTLWKVILDKLDNAPTRDIAKNSMVHTNVVSHNHQENVALPNKGIIKSSSKLLSPKYQAQPSLGEEGHNAINSEDCDLDEDDGKMMENESRASKIIVDEGEASIDQGLGSTSGIRACALRNFDLEVMKFESAQSNATAKLPILKLENGSSVTKMSVPATAEEKTNKKNDVKAKSLLLMALPNEHQLTFSQYSDAKTIFAAIETRFRESLDSIFNRLQKIMNKANIETMSIDDLYNNFKIVEQDVKKSVGASTGAQNMAFMIAPSTSSTNDVNTAKPVYEVSTVSPHVNTSSPQVSTANFSDYDVYAFMVENPNGSNLLQQDLEQIHEDDLEAMDLKWQLSLLSMRAKRECKAPRNKDGQFRYQDNTRKKGNNEDTYSKAMLAIDGVGFDWSDMAEEQVLTNMALMAFSDSELNQTEFKATTYKRGLTTVEEQLVTYRKNEVLFNEEVAVLKREVACKDYEISVLKSEFEKVKQEKEGIEFKIKKFDNALKSLDKLLGSQITDKRKKGLGYNVVPPPHHLIYNAPTKLDLSYSGLDEFKEP
ncbi:hypothetical protein Tco_0150221 [Tanacetum coccineum]